MLHHLIFSEYYQNLAIITIIATLGLIDGFRRHKRVLAKNKIKGEHP